MEDCLSFFDVIDFDNTNNNKIREIPESFCSIRFKKDTAIIFTSVNLLTGGIFTLHAVEEWFCIITGAR